MIHQPWATGLLRNCVSFYCYLSETNKIKNFFEKSEEHNSCKLMLMTFYDLKEPILTRLTAIYIDPTSLGVQLVRDTTHLMSLLGIFSLETGQKLVCMIEDCVFGLVTLTQSINILYCLVLFCLYW